MRGASRPRCRRRPRTPATVRSYQAGRSARATARTPRRPRATKSSASRRGRSRRRRRSGARRRSARDRTAAAAPRNRSTRSRRSASKNRASAVASIEVNTRNGLRASSIRVDRTERGRHHRHRGRGLAQVVVADRVHAERREEIGDLGEFAGAAHPDRAVAFGGDPLERAEPLVVAQRRRFTSVLTSTSVV